MTQIKGYKWDSQALELAFVACSVMMPVLLCVLPPRQGAGCRGSCSRQGGCHHEAGNGQTTGWGLRSERVLGAPEAFEDSQAGKSLDLARGMQMRTAGASVVLG